MEITRMHNPGIRPGHGAILALAASALLIGCAPKAVKLEQFKERVDSYSVSGYDHRMYIDYKRIAQQTSKYFIQYVKTGSDSSRNMFLVSLDLLVGERNPLKQQANLTYLMKDTVYSQIRESYRKVEPDADADMFLDAINEIRLKGKNAKIWANRKYREEFIAIVMKYCR